MRNRYLPLLAAAVLCAAGGTAAAVWAQAGLTAQDVRELNAMPEAEAIETFAAFQLLADALWTEKVRRDPSLDADDLYGEGPPPLDASMKAELRAMSDSELDEKYRDTVAAIDILDARLDDDDDETATVAADEDGEDRATPAQPARQANAPSASASGSPSAGAPGSVNGTWNCMRSVMSQFSTLEQPGFKFVVAGGSWTDLTWGAKHAVTGKARYSGGQLTLFNAKTGAPLHRFVWRSGAGQSSRLVELIDPTTNKVRTGEVCYSKEYP